MKVNLSRILTIIASAFILFNTIPALSYVHDDLDFVPMGDGAVSVVYPHQVNVPYVESPVVSIDGQVNMSEWTGAWSLTESFIHDGGGEPIDSCVRLMHDGSFLYVAIETPLSAGWDSKARVRIDGDNSGTLKGNLTAPYHDIQSEKGAPGSWSGYSNYQSFVKATQAKRVTPGAGYAQASYGRTNVSYEFKIPLSDLGCTTGSTFRMLVYASPDATNAWYWPVCDSGGGGLNPVVWGVFPLDQAIDNKQS